MPTLSGLGEREHFATPDIDLSTHVTDIASVLHYEQLWNVILVGWSYGGMVITGVAERMAKRIAHLVYLDAFLPEDGESVASFCPEDNPLVASVSELVAQGESGLPHLPREASRRVGQPLGTRSGPPSENVPPQALHLWRCTSSVWRPRSVHGRRR